MCPRCDAVKERREAAFRLALACDPVGTALKRLWQVDEPIPPHLLQLLDRLK